MADGTMSAGVAIRQGTVPAADCANAAGSTLPAEAGIRACEQAVDDGHGRFGYCQRISRSGEIPRGKS